MRCMNINLVGKATPDVEVAQVTLGGATQKILIIKRAGHFRALNEGNVL